KTQTEEQRQRQGEVQRKLNEELEEHQWKQQVLAEQRPEMIDKLAAHRAELSHLEDHILKLKQEADQLQQQLKDLQEIDSVRKEDQGALKAELAKLLDEIERAVDELNKARTEAAEKPKSYSLILYKGPNGTARRPIYIECTRRSVTLQPEGIVLKRGDFLAPLVPGNPLDAALLAVREYLVRSGAVTKDGEPYPLLIVRPNGTEAYAMARAAMKSWDDEFGYELIDDKLNLKYQDADPVLAKTIRDAVELARRRQAALVQAQPSRFATSGLGGSKSDDSPVVLRPRPGGGGFVREGGAGQDPFFDSESKRDGFTGGGTTQSNEENPLRGSANNQNHPDNREFFGPSPKFGAPSDSSPGGTPSPASVGGSKNCLAESRGKNWGLKNYSNNATAYTRPIRVVCYGDRIELIPQRATGERPYVTRLQGDTVAAIDEFVSNTWKHMQGWGIAGRSAYWKPILSVEVA
ncbi:MAG: hypothetical protein QGF59_17255, partial [Pirellulaceae bacterium]|nr:hypothetical protein [Pirellulaceae bacterium]